MTSATKTIKGKSMQGVVVKTAMKDTCTVAVSRYVKHPVYGKYFKRTKKYLVHDAGNTAKVGDTVEINETRPMSKLKRFKLGTVIKAAVIEE